MTRKAERMDLPQLAALCCRLWPSHTMEEMLEEVRVTLRHPQVAFFLAEDGGEAVGFAQCQLRYDYVEGTNTSPVGYLEGIYIREEYRHQGHGRQLLRACEQWAAQQGCREFASDCELDNAESLRFHLHMGFGEANRIICFTKQL